MGEITAKTYTKAKVTGYVGSIGTGIILFLFLFFTYIYTPIPPYPEGGGGGGMDVEVNLGYAETGFGDLQQPDIAIPDFTNQPAPAPPAESKPQEILSQDLEETASISENPKPEKKKPEQKVVSNVKPEKKTEPKKTQPVVEQPKKVNTTALYKPKTGTSSSQGNTQGATDQGSLTGRQSSNVYGPGGSGGNGPGSGGGSGGGIGEGIGSGVGDGVGPGYVLNLKNRTAIVMRIPEFTVQREGIVVVEITVDQNGKVIAANPGVKGTTIADKTLWAAAKKAALESKFNVKSDAPIQQIGTINYHFKLQ